MSADRFAKGGLTVDREAEGFTFSVHGKHFIEAARLTDAEAEELRGWLTHPAGAPKRIKSNDPRFVNRCGTVVGEDGDRWVVEWDVVPPAGRSVTRVSKSRVGTKGASGYTVLATTDALRRPQGG